MAFLKVNPPHVLDMPKNLHSPIPRPPSWLPEHRYLPFDCVTEAKLIMNPTEFTYTQSQPPTQTHPSLSFFALAGQSINTTLML